MSSSWFSGGAPVSHKFGGCGVPLVLQLVPVGFVFLESPGTTLPLSGEPPTVRVEMVEIEVAIEEECAARRGLGRGTPFNSSLDFLSSSSSGSAVRPRSATAPQPSANQSDILARQFPSSLLVSMAS